jgi:MFS transporter, MCT family, solute carrier family 16 (monocarboxylic acid transporters), member 10
MGLQAFAAALHVSKTRSALILSLLNASSVLGRLGAGNLSDSYDPWALGLASLAAASLVTVTLWGVAAHTFGGLVAFALLYGALAGGFSSLWTGLTRCARPFAVQCAVFAHIVSQVH